MHKRFSCVWRTCVCVDSIIGFYHNKACITRSGSQGGARGAASDACSQSNSQSSGIVSPRLPLMTKDKRITKEPTLFCLSKILFYWSHCFWRKKIRNITFGFHSSATWWLLRINELFCAWRCTLSWPICFVPCKIMIVTPPQSPAGQHSHCSYPDSAWAWLLLALASSLWENMTVTSLDLWLTWSLKIWPSHIHWRLIFSETRGDCGGILLYIIIR